MTQLIFSEKAQHFNRKASNCNIIKIIFATVALIIFSIASIFIIASILGEPSFDMTLLEELKYKVQFFFIGIAISFIGFIFYSLYKHFNSKQKIYIEKVNTENLKEKKAIEEKAFRNGVQSEITAQKNLADKKAKRVNSVFTIHS